MDILKNVIEINDNIFESKLADTFRMGYKTDDLLEIFFGEIKESNNNSEEFIVEVKAAVAIPPEKILLLVESLISAGVSYQEKTGKNIGFPKSRSDAL